MNDLPHVQWVFRHAGGSLIETPDLPSPPRDSGWRRWAATLWPDAAQPDGWAALEWCAASRGWWLPSTLAVGDIVEFGVCWTAWRRPHVHRWFGWVDYTTPLALVLNGPYVHPDLALIDARPSV